MSGPKGGHIQVVSREELERRALATATDRFNRVTEAFREVAAALTTYDHHLQVAQLPRGTSQVVTRAADEVESRLAAARVLLTESRVAAALAATPKIKRNIDFTRLASASPEKSAPAATTVSASGEAGMAVDPVARATAAVERALRDLGDGPATDLLHRLAGIQKSAGTAQARIGYDDLTFTIQKLRTRKKEQDAAIALREQALAALDGCVSEEAAAARTRLTTTPPGDPVPLSLHYVQSLAQRDHAAQEAAFVHAAAVEVLAELGFEFSPDSSTLSSPDGVLIGVPDHPHHIARLHRDGAELGFYVIRVGEPADPREDAAAEVAACGVFEELHEGLADTGIEWILSRREPAGAFEVVGVAAEPAGVVRAPVRRKRARRRQRERELGR